MAVGPPYAHILIAAAPAMGHIRQLLGFASKIVRECPGSVTVTIPVTGDIIHVLDKELTRYFPSEKDKKLKEDFHIISLGGSGSVIPLLFQLYLREFSTFYTSLETLTPIQCATGPTHTFRYPPTIVIADFFLWSGIQSIRKISKRNIPVACWIPGSLAPIMRLLGPEELGGLGDIVAKAKELAQKTGRPQADIEFDLSYPEEGKVVHCPGMPPMFDYEYYPQEANPEIRKLQVPLHLEAYTIICQSDVLISASSAAFEPEATAATRAWCAKSNRPFYCGGPVLPDDVLGDTLSSDTLQTKVGLSTKDQEVIAFLDKVYATFGEHSLLYCSFGTIFWPQSKAIWSVFEDIVDMNIPLLLVYDNVRCGNMPETTAAKLKSSDKVMITDFVPQQFVLNNRVTGWFLTHCGYNSMIESVVLGVPMIALPLDAEQPGIAAYVSQKLDIAYEVIEARSGTGLKPMFRGVQPKGTEKALRAEMKGILEDAFGGEGGKRKRANVLAYQEKVKAGWKEGGASRADFLKFVEDYISV